MGFLDTALSMGGDLVTGWLNNQYAEDRQNAAQNFSAQQYATRYQTTVKDMQAAGLNPMLAYGQGPGNAPGGVVGSSNATPSLGSSFNQSSIASAQVANIHADTENKKAQSDLIEAQAMQARSSANLQSAQYEQTNMMVKDLTQKLENNYWKSETDRILAVAKELQSQYELNIQKGMSEQSARGLMYAQAVKLDAETDLLKMDISAADEMGNLKRRAGQLAPVVDMVTGLAGMRSRSSTVTHIRKGSK